MADRMRNAQEKDWLGRGWAFPVRIDPLRGGIQMAEYEDDIRQAIMILIGTARGERVMRADFGCGIHELVFEHLDVATLTRVETEVRETLIAYEPRIELIAVRADPRSATEGRLDVSVEYRVRRTNQSDNLVYPFYFREGGPGSVETGR